MSFIKFFPTGENTAPKILDTSLRGFLIALGRGILLIIEAVFTSSASIEDTLEAVGLDINPSDSTSPLAKLSSLSLIRVSENLFSPAI